MSKIEIRDLVKRYGTFEALHAINFHVAPGEFAVLVGPSGCGKSTTLRMIAGLETISGGEIAIGGRVVNGLRPKQRGIAMVFQNYALYPSKSVYENMAFSLRLSHVPKPEIDRRVRAVAQTLELSELLQRKPAELSGGQRQRVAMGRAIVRDPQVFLFDEPLSNLDAKLRGQMRVEIKRLHQRLNNTIIYVTHDQVEAMTLADRIVVMRDGYIEQQGTPDEIFHDPANAFVAGFIGSPAMNLVKAVAGPGSANIGDTSIEWKCPTAIAQGKTITLGIRPDDICLAAEAPHIETRKQVTVDLVEHLGTEKLLYFNLGGESMVGKADGHARIAEGEKVEIALDMQHAYGFSSETGARLR